MDGPTKRPLDLNAAGIPGGVHYAWMIAGILALVHVVGESIFTVGGIVVVPLTDEGGDYRWSMAIIGSGLMLYYLVGAFLSPVTGWLGDRYGARRLMLFNSFLFGGGLIFLGMMSSPWQFFLAYSVLLSLSGSICFVPLVSTINDWFRRRLGVAVGILFAAGGIGSAILSVLVGYLVDTVGWREAFISVGLGGGLILLMLTLVYRNHPSDKGIEPYGTRPDDPPSRPKSRSIERLRSKVYNQHMRGTRAFWNLPIIHGLGCAGHGIIFIYSIPLAYDRGVFSSLGAAAMVIALVNIFSVISRFAAPIIAERFGGKPSIAYALLMQGLTVLILFWAQDAWVFYLFAVIFGLGYGAEMSAYLVVNRQYFGQGPLATCYGFQTAGALMGHAIATGLAGLVLFVTDSYTTILVMSMAFSLVGVLVITNMESTSKVLIPNWEESLPAEAKSSGPSPGRLIPHPDL